MAKEKRYTFPEIVGLFLIVPAVRTTALETYHQKDVRTTTSRVVEDHLSSREQPSTLNMV